jgi:hypothetical protein
VDEGGQGGTFIFCWWECELVQPLWKSEWRFPKKLKIELSYNPVKLFPGIYLKECKSAYNRHTCTTMFIVALTITKLWNQPRCSSTNEWIKKCSIVYKDIHNGILFSHKEEQNYVVCWKMDRTRELEMLSEISQAQKDEYHMFSLISRI